LVGRLTKDLHASDPETEAAWQREITSRIEEIQSGQVEGIPGEEVSARISKIVGRWIVAVMHSKRHPGYWRDRLSL
jgi:putative addiction module component (TIGR02574 family)